MGKRQSKKRQSPIDISQIARDMSNLYKDEYKKFIEVVYKSLIEISTHVSALEKLSIEKGIFKNKEINKKQKDIKRDLIIKHKSTFGKIGK